MVMLLFRYFLDVSVGPFTILLKYYVTKTYQESYIDIYSFSRSKFSTLKQKLGKNVLKIVVNILKVLLTLRVFPASGPEVFPLTSKVTGVTSMQCCSTLQPLTQCDTGVVRCHGTTALMLNSIALLFPVFRQQEKKSKKTYFFSAAFIFFATF